MEYFTQLYTTQPPPQIGDKVFWLSQEATITEIGASKEIVSRYHDPITETVISLTNDIGPSIVVQGPLCVRHYRMER